MFRVFFEPHLASNGVRFIWVATDHYGRTVGPVAFERGVNAVYFKHAAREVGMQNMTG